MQSGTNSQLISPAVRKLLSYNFIISNDLGVS